MRDYREPYTTKVGKRFEKGVIISPPRTKRNFWWNPSITKFKGDIYVSFRGWQKNPGIWREYTSLLAVGKLKDDKLVEYKVLKPRNSSEIVMNNGVEDVRIFERDGKLYGIGVVLFQENPLSKRPRAGVKQALLGIDYDKGTYEVIEEYKSPKGTPEKNWSPIEGKDGVFHYAIGEIWEDGELTKTTNLSRNITPVHNGTPLMKVHDGYVGVFHQRIMLRPRAFRYPNLFIKFDENLKPIGMSDWFVFDDYANEEVQFICGGMSVGDELWITVGLDRIQARVEADYKGLLYKVKYSDIEFKDFDERKLPITRGVLGE